MRFFLTLLLLLLAAPVCLATPEVVVSIAPVHSLVSALTRGLYEPQLLLTQGNSPHSTSLRPSQARALADADLLIWIGPQLESSLARSIARLTRPEADMRLLPLEGLKLLAQRQGGFWEQGADHKQERHDHSDQGVNPHIWLSPFNAKLIAQAVTRRLAQIDPQNQAVYEANLAALCQRIDLLQRELSEQLKSVQKRPYLVFHDAYPYFEQAFSLNAVGSIRISAERAPSARRLQQIQSRLIKSNVLCLFSEPQFSAALAQRITSTSGLKSGILDPLGKTSEPGEDAWFILMENLAQNLLSCLGPQEQADQNGPSSVDHASD